MALLETNQEEIIDIDLSPTRKKKFRIDGDATRIIELNISDMGIVSRIADSYSKLDELSKKALEIEADSDVMENAETAEERDSAMVSLGSSIKEIDTEMRKIIDEIFDSNVSEVCVPSGSMFDPFNGKLRYEYIMDALLPHYEENISSEAKKVKANVAKHTAKYTNKGRK